METQSDNNTPINKVLESTSSRRDLLKWIGTASVALFTLQLTKPIRAAEEITGKKMLDPPPDGENTDWSAHKWGMGIDVEKCIGCGQCVVACKNENDVPNEPEFFRTWIERYRELEGETKVDSPNGGYDGFPPIEEEKNQIRSFFVPKLCNACESSPCVQVCPVGATFETPDGAVLVDPTYCIGCRYCVQACPYSCRFIHPVTHVADKCTFCYHRIHKGLLPACVDNCPTSARVFGDLKDPKSPVSKFMKSHKTFVLKPHLNTNPNVAYSGIDREVR